MLMNPVATPAIDPKDAFGADEDFAGPEIGPVYFNASLGFRVYSVDGKLHSLEPTHNFIFKSKSYLEEISLKDKTVRTRYFAEEGHIDKTVELEFPERLVKSHFFVPSEDSDRMVEPYKGDTMDGWETLEDIRSGVVSSYEARVVLTGEIVTIGTNVRSPFSQELL